MKREPPALIHAYHQEYIITECAYNYAVKQMLGIILILG